MQLETTKPYRNNTQIVEALRAECARNPILSAVCHVFAIRERARQQVTIGSLVLRMAQEGYKYTKGDYQNVLRFFANLGIGTLEFNPNNKEVRALKNIRLTLQSIGRAAVTTDNVLEKFNPAFDYKDLVAPTNASVAVQAAPMKPVIPPPPIEPGAPIPKPATRPPRLKLPQYAALLTVIIDGNRVEFPLPKGITTAELGELLADLHSRGEPQ